MSQTTTGKKPTTITFTYHDPSRTFDGTPYEAAGKSIKQTSSVLKLFRRSVVDTGVQVRNAYMQRNLDLGKEPGAENWTGSPEHKLLVNFITVTERMQAKLNALHRSASYNPKDPEKE